MTEPQIEPGKQTIIISAECMLWRVPAHWDCRHPMCAVACTPLTRLIARTTILRGQRKRTRSTRTPYSMHGRRSTNLKAEQFNYSNDNARFMAGTVHSDVRDTQHANGRQKYPTPLLPCISGFSDDCVSNAVNCRGHDVSCMWRCERNTIYLSVVDLIGRLRFG